MKFLSSLLLFMLCCSSSLYAQRAQLKNPFGKTAQDTLNRVLQECFGISTNLNVYYSSTELYNSKVTREADADMASVDALKKKLKGNDADAPVLLDLWSLYARMNQQAEGKTYLDQCLAIQLAQQKQYPDSVGVHLALAATYMAASDLDNIILNYRKAWAADPSMSTAPIMLSTVWMIASEMDSATAVVESYLKQSPGRKDFYEALPLYYLNKNVMQPITRAGSPEELKTLTFEKVVEMPHLEAYYQNHRNEFEAEYVYRVSRQINMCALVPMRASVDSSFDYESPRFRLSAADRKSLLESKGFFEGCLAKEVKYQLYANKLLGRLYILLDEPAKAVPYLKKAIALKPPSNCSLNSNSNEDYEALATAYYILKDSSNLEKLFLEKIKQRIAIDPVAGDYDNLEALYIVKGQYDKAREICTKALAIDPASTNALTALGTVEYLQGHSDKAMEYVNRIFVIDSKKWELYVLYGAILLKQGDVNNAYESFKTVERLHDRDWVREELLEYFFTN